MRLSAVLFLLAACGPPPPPAPTTVHTTYRVLGGLSMGAIGTAALGFRHPEAFDALGALGGPLDAALLLRTVDHFHTGGFCPRATLEANLATLNDPRTAGCVTHPPTIKYEHPQDFNHWVYTTNAPFNRTSYVGLFTDLTLAFGNLLTENEASTFAPPRISDAFARFPPQDFCANPAVVAGLKNLEFNPDGKYDAITFCDGEPTTFFCNSTREVVDFCSDPANLASPLPVSAQAAFAAAACASQGGASVATRETHPDIMQKAGGRTDPCRQATVPVQVALAFDLNRNGRRDFGEPLVNNGEERYQDVGRDGCPDAREDGSGGCRESPDPAAVDPNHDDYDADANPLGTEGDWRHEDGEPFSDDGLDGVPGSGDFGENNGQFDMTSGRRRLYAHDAREAMATLSTAQIARLNLLLDGGIRDLFNFGLTAHQVYGRWKALRPDDTQTYRDFLEIPGMADRTGTSYKPWGGPWTRAPHNLEVLYGKETVTDAERLTGDGDHVGTNSQAVNRLATLFSWAAAQWPSLERPATPLTGQGYDERERYEWYDSAVLGGKRGYGVFLPPGYDAPENAAARYPVLYLLHGYTGDPKQILPSAFLADTFMKDSDAKLRPMLIVAPSGACCFIQAGTGQRDCRETDDAGKPLAGQSGWRRECVAGNFFVSQVGAAKYEESLFELMQHIDSKFRTLAPADVTER
ncbi:MAG: hypothetical protein IPJ65_43985 [Archangiaceae bacterium]|nr:hypothetical protein [Archangiaceae bacterium]